MDAETLPEGWARPPMSSFFHWYDGVDVPASDAPRAPSRPSVCRLARYRGATIPDIRRWEADPAVCELCRDIRRARALGRPIPGQPTRTVALLPVGLPDEIRTFFRAASANAAEDRSPFHQTLAQFRSVGVTRPLLLAFFRWEAVQSGKPPKTRPRWGEIVFDEVRELPTVARVRLLREPIEPSADLLQT